MPGTAGPARGRLPLYGAPDRHPWPASVTHGRGVRPAGSDPALRSGPVVADPARTATLQDAVGLGVAVGLYGAAFGAAAVGAGLSTWQAVALSALMFTGASQFALVGVVGAGGGPLAAVGSALLLGTRNTVYGVRLAPVLTPRGRLRRAAAAHWVIDESTAMAVAAPDRELGRLAFWVTGGTIYLGWNAMTLIGALGAGSLGETAQAALDAVVPAAFLGLLWPRLRRGAPEAAAQRRVALGGAVVALALTPFVPAGLQVVLAVAAVALVGRRRPGTAT